MRAVDRILVLLSLCGLLLNLLLLYWKLADSSSEIAGCGGGDCSAVLGSRWGQVLGLPVAAAGVAVYLLLFAALLWGWKFPAAACYVAILGAASWFIFVQAVLLKQFCPWCMAAHGTGLVIAAVGLWSQPWDHRFKNGMQAGLFAGLALALAQVYGPAPAGYRIDGMIPARGRELSFEGGHRTYGAAVLPCLGSADAPHVMVEYFDYRCPACRKMRGYLEALVRKHPDKVAVLALPVPLERSCNGRMAPADGNHPGSCALARIALAVWRVKPEAFAEIHRAFLSDSPPEEADAMRLAASLVSAADLEAALRDPWIERALRTHIDDWAVLSKETGKLPKLLIRDRRILHGLPSGEADFIRVMERELGL
jgi:uncharacterized membrane protein